MGDKPFKPYVLELDEFGIEIPKKKMRDALNEVASFLEIELLNYYEGLNSPVSGGKWRSQLTKEYARKKAQEVGSTVANLELSGDLLNSLKITPKIRANEIVIDVGKREYGKSEGHITGQYGKGKMEKDYRRQFLPQGNEKFKRGILTNIKNILKEYEED